jgi:hypothetical protein
MASGDLSAGRKRGIQFCLKFDFFEIAAMNRSKANRSAMFCMHLNRDSSEI